ncbi:hypothetical protein [Vibrio alginolyticus]|uniref:hypothetical protein n=1 Tax=Vibrio alginolyticus TaxID=663 RepID=UPI0007200E5E|nr:hypothetical protein [Vibrio alginolyticus]ALR91765.1 hypothetical protein AT730_04905 [Vibrio alginolyticus]MBY7708780.1 hypothetical protein [Vibrio alginolyticus]
MTEKVKRLTPKPEVLRELFLKSGNVCAFPNCLHPIVDTNGVYVAQLCHIEAASVGGQRFNKDQTNEQRRQFENLLLMCHRHHKETDDVDKFDVARMREIKRKHEAKFEKVLDSLANDVYDVALAYEPKKAKSLKALIGLKLIEQSEEHIYQSELDELVSLLNKVSPATRKIFSIVLNRADENCEFLLNEFQYIVSMDAREAYNHIAILEKYGLLHDNEDTERFERKLCINSVTTDSQYPVAMMLKEFSEKHSCDLNTMVVDLDLSDLDANA